MDQQKTFVATVLEILNENDILISKMLLQKFIYFLETQNINTGFCFEPYTYGPYSFSLASTLGSMNFWDEIKENYSSITIINLNNYIIDDKLKGSIQQKLFQFRDLVGTFDFKNLELAGTLLYCAQVLKNYGEKIDENSLSEEFKGWKQNKYTDLEIHHTYEKLKKLL